MFLHSQLVTFFLCPSQESNCKISITNQKDKDICWDPTNASARPQKATEDKRLIYRVIHDWQM